MLKVKGESMINAGIFDGDNIIVERCSTAQNGEMVVALVDDSATVKTFYKEDGHIRLKLEISQPHLTDHSSGLYDIILAPGDGTEIQFQWSTGDRIWAGGVQSAEAGTDGTLPTSDSRTSTIRN